MEQIFFLNKMNSFNYVFSAHSIEPPSPRAHTKSEVCKHKTLRLIAPHLFTSMVLKSVKSPAGALLPAFTGPGSLSSAKQTSYGSIMSLFAVRLPGSIAIPTTA